MGKKMKFLKHLSVEGGIIVFVAYLLYVSLGHKLFFFDDVQNLILYDLAADTDLTKSSDKVKDVVCVSIDDSLKRGDILLTLQRILASEPAVVGIDIKFEKPEYTRTDTLLENLIRKNKSRIVLSYDQDKNDGPDSYSYFVKSYEDYPYLGYVHKPVMIKDRVRILKLEDRNRTSFVSLLSKLYNGKELNDVDNQRLIINYKHKHTPMKSDLLSHQRNRDMLKGKVVIVGVEHQREDLHYTPKGIENGYMIQFYALKSLLEYEFNFRYRYCVSLIFMGVSVFILFGMKYLSRKYFFANSLIDSIMFAVMIGLYVVCQIFFCLFDYTTAALWNTIPMVAFLTLGGYSFIVILLGKSEKLNMKLAAKCSSGEKLFLAPVIKLLVKGFHWIFNKTRKSFLWNEKE